MNQKQRALTYIIAIIFGTMGFLCFGVAGMLQAKPGNTCANFIGIIGFTFLTLALIYLIVKFPKLFLSEIEAEAKSLESEINFFSAINIEESNTSLKEKFLKAGFLKGSNYLHKKSFSFIKGDYINYYVFLVDNAVIEQYVETFLNQIDTLIESRKRFNKNNYIYLIFFNNHSSYNELIPLKNLIISQDVFQGISHSHYLDYVIPILYNIDDKEYILRISKRKIIMKPIDIAMKNFCKIVFKR
jgi:hypothetical protein